MEFLIFLAIAAIVIIVNVLKRIHSEGSGKASPLEALFSSSPRNEEWMKAAGSLRLEYSRPSGVFDSPSIEGEIDGYPVSVDVEGGSDPTTSYSVDFPSPLDIDLYFSFREHLEKIADFIDAETPVQNIFAMLKAASSGDNALSKKLEGFLEKHGKPYFMNVLKLQPDFSVSEDGVFLEVEGIDSTSACICARVKALLRAAKAIYALAGGEREKETENAGKPENPDIPAYIEPPKAEPEKPHVAAPAATPAPVHAPQAATEANGDSTPDRLASALFSSTLSGQKEKDEFARVKGNIVRWTGKLISSYEYSMDFNFGSKPGTKATFEVCEISGAYSMKSKVKAVVQLPKEAANLLKGKSGQTVSFKGSLEKFEPFAKEIYISSGELA